MSRQTVRRQIWLLAILAGLALLWWQSSTSDRYADLSGYDASANPLPVPPGLGTRALTSELASPAVWYYADRHNPTGIRVTWRTTLDTTSLEVITINSGRATRNVAAEVVGGYYPNWIKVRGTPEGLGYDVRITGDSMYVAREGETVEPRGYPVPRGALFEDLVLVQAMAWQSLTDSATTHMIAFSETDPPLRVFKVVLSRADSGRITITASPTQSARIHFADDSPRITSYCTATGDCFESRREQTFQQELIEAPVDSLVAEEAP